jgi:argininosuccinate lyase
LTPGVREVLTVQGSLDSRSTINGTAPASVRKQLATAEKNIADLKKWSAKLPHSV